MRLLEHVARMGHLNNACKIWFGNLKIGVHLEGLETEDIHLQQDRNQWLVWTR